MTYDIHHRKGLPPEMQTLLRDLPRDSWPDHPNFARATQNWIGAHRGFRQLGSFILTDTQAFLDQEKEARSYAGHLGYYGNMLVRNLHGHHTWEDRSYFPELAAADPRFERGLDMLENDHLEMDILLERFTQQANRVIKLSTLEPAQMEEEAKPLRDTSEALNRFLTRHLTDEEDLVVPIILHHKLRGARDDIALS